MTDGHAAGAGPACRRAFAQAPASRADGHAGAAAAQPRRTTTPTSISTSRSPTSPLDAADHPAAAAAQSWRSASRTASRGRWARATSAIWSRTSSASTRARRSASTTGTALFRGAPDRRSSHLQPDHPVLRPVRAARSAERRSRSASTVVATSTAPTTSGTAIRPGSACVVSRELGDRGGALRRADLGQQHQPVPDELVDDNDTFIIGLGARVPRAAATPTCVVEGSPRVGGYDPGDDACQLRHREARRRPHVPAELLERLRHDVRPDGARRHVNDDWYIGFNISRKFLLMTRVDTGKVSCDDAGGIWWSR